MDGISGNKFSPAPPGTGPAAKGEAMLSGPVDSLVLTGKSSPPGILEQKQARALAQSPGAGQAAGHVVEVTDATFESFIRNATLPVLVNFHNPT